MKPSSLLPVLMLVFALPASASELLVNGDFSAGSLGWHISGYNGGGPSELYVGEPYAPGFARFSGNANGGPGLSDLLWQTFATVPGETYTFSYYLAHSCGTFPPGYPIDACSMNFMWVRWDTNLVSTIVSQPNFGFTLFSFTQVASTSLSRITFEGAATPGAYVLDNVSVTGAAPVPEPATMTLVGGGLVFAAYQRRRRQRAS